MSPLKIQINNSFLAKVSKNDRKQIKHDIEFHCVGFDHQRSLCERSVKHTLSHRYISSVFNIVLKLTYKRLSACDVLNKREMKTRRAEDLKSTGKTRSNILVCMLKMLGMFVCRTKNP